MRILFLDNHSFGKLDMVAAFTKLGCDVDMFYHEHICERRSPEFAEAFRHQLAGKEYSFVFSINYFPQLSTACMEHHIKYISYVYDSPLVALYSYTVINSCNYIFLFDKTQYLHLRKGGITTVYYLPLAANPARLAQMLPTPSIHEKLDCDVSFVGSLYNEKHNLFETLKDLPDYTRGYLDALMDAQLKVSGYFFAEDLLTPDIVAALKRANNYEHQPDGVETESYVYANYFIARKLTQKERMQLLNTVSSHYMLNLYTHNPAPELPHARYIGPIDYYDVMPYVFKCSKINLNITLRSIQSGIPLRAFDILGAGGFLLTNYQADFFDCFTPDEDFVYYEDEPDLLEKIEYYLSHERERMEIAENGCRKVVSSHTYEHRIREMMETAL